MRPLSDKERSAALATLPGWSHEPVCDAFFQTFEFRHFVTAFSFMTAVALEAEKSGHYPEWSSTTPATQMWAVCRNGTSCWHLKLH